VSDQLGAPPTSDDLIDKPRFKGDTLAGKISQVWIEFFNSLARAINLAPSRSAVVQATGLEDSVAATDMTGGGLAEGLYRLSYYFRITRAASTSSSLTLGLDWVDHTQTLTYTGPAATGNTVTTYQTATAMVFVDRAAPVRYSIAYVSVGAVAMQYELFLIMERIST
jgi:hypothetical protein